MTAVVPDVDVTHLDFDTPVLCRIDDCGRNPVQAKRAVMAIILHFTCCVRAAPICEDHMGPICVAIMTHQGLVCETHGVDDCAHRAATFRALP